MITLTAPTRVSPASAAWQKQHHNNNEYGFHVVTSPAGKLDWFINGSSHFFAIQDHKKELRPGSVHIGPLWEFDLYGVSLQIVNGFALWFAGSLRSDSFVPTFAPYRWMRLLLKSLGPALSLGPAMMTRRALPHILGAQLEPSFLTAPRHGLMTAVQVMCARIRMVTGQGLPGTQTAISELAVGRLRDGPARCKHDQHCGGPCWHG